MMPDRAPSLVTTAHFWKRPAALPPVIVSPAGPELPPAEVGKPYRLAFQTQPGGATCWREAAELRNYEPGKKKGVIVKPTGLSLDPQTGVLSGSPERGGVYWVQIQVAAKPGRIGSLRNYSLRVAGEGGQAAGVAADSHVVLCRMVGWSAEQVVALQAVLEAAGVAAHVQPGSDASGRHPCQRIRRWARCDRARHAQTRHRPRRPDRSGSAMSHACQGRASQTRSADRPTGGCIPAIKGQR